MRTEAAKEHKVHLLLAMVPISTICWALGVICNFLYFLPHLNFGEMKQVLLQNKNLFRDTLFFRSGIGAKWPFFKKTWSI